MRTNYVQYGSPQFRILSDKQIEELHFASLQIMERAGGDFECQEAIDILDEADTDVSKTDSVKIPYYDEQLHTLLVENPKRVLPFAPAKE